MNRTHAEQLTVGESASPPIAATLHVDYTPSEIADALVTHAGGFEPFQAKAGRAIRRSFDLAYDGQHTGRYRWEQLSKTEKTNIGSLVEIWLGRELELADGVTMDFSIAGYEVDCKFSGRAGGWMLPPEVVGHFALLVTANDATSLMSIGVIEVTADRLSHGTNRDMKATFNRDHLADIHWILKDATFPENTLLQIAPMDAVAVTRKERNGQRVSGQERVDLLFRYAEGRRVSRNVIATVAQQDDFMKRVRSNGGSRTRLAEHGYLLLGHYQAHRRVAIALGVPTPDVGEIVSVRVTRTEPQEGSVEIAGHHWRRWAQGDPDGIAPVLAHNER